MEIEQQMKRGTLRVICTAKKKYKKISGPLRSEEWVEWRGGGKIRKPKVNHNDKQNKTRRNAHPSISLLPHHSLCPARTALQNEIIPLVQFLLQVQRVNIEKVYENAGGEGVEWALGGAVKCVCVGLMSLLTECVCVCVCVCGMLT